MDTNEYTGPATITVEGVAIDVQVRLQKHQEHDGRGLTGWGGTARTVPADALWDAVGKNCPLRIGDRESIALVKDLGTLSGAGPVPF